MLLEQLRKEIDELRERLEERIEDSDYVLEDMDVLKVSQELDIKINEYNQIILEYKVVYEEDRCCS